MVTNKKFMYRVATFAAVATLGMTTLTGCSSNKGNNAGDANNATGTTTPGTSTTDVSATPNADLTKTVYTIDGNPVTLQDMMQTKMRCMQLTLVGTSGKRLMKRQD